MKMFDLTKNIKLSGKDMAIYQKWRIFLYLFALAIALYLVFLVLFPKAVFNYSFDSSSLKNTIDEPRDASGNELDHGNIPAVGGAYFDSSPTGNFSGVDVFVKLDKNSDEYQGAEIEVKKSYRSFLYPEGEPFGFMDGSLLKNSGKYFIVSEDKLRQFESIDSALGMGFSAEAFIPVEEKELPANEPGEMIREGQYPEATIFRVGNEFYYLFEDKLVKFISREAYLTRYDENTAIPKNDDLFSTFPLTDNVIGFADGTAISYAGGVFIASGGNVFPVDLPETFTAKNFNWENVLPASGDEFSQYKKGKIFTVRSPHPDGTIFHATDTDKFYMIKEGKKHPFPSRAIARSWSKNAPIPVSEKSLTTTKKCELEKKPFSMRNYGCRFSLTDFSDIPGSEYEFHLLPTGNIKADGLQATFFKEVNYLELRTSGKSLYNRIKGSYAP